MHSLREVAETIGDFRIEHVLPSIAVSRVARSVHHNIKACIRSLQVIVQVIQAVMGPRHGSEGWRETRALLPSGAAALWQELIRSPQDMRVSAGHRDGTDGRASPHHLLNA